jgi:hypothetical protein
MIRLTRTDYIRYLVIAPKAEAHRIVELFSAGPSSTSGVWPETGPGEVFGRDDMVTYVLVVHANDAEAIARVEGLVKG